MKQYPMFISWLSENYTNLPDNSPFANSKVLKKLGIEVDESANNQSEGSTNSGAKDVNHYMNMLQ